MRIGVDAMGGDRAPATEIAGVLDARALLDPGDRIALIGDEAILIPQLNDSGVSDWPEFIDVYPASERIAMNESPIDAIRTKPDSSLVVMVGLHAAGKIDACVSAGNTGAFAAASSVAMRRLKGVQRVGIAIVVPTLHGPVVVCDVGASVSCRPKHLHQYAIMASVFAERVTRVSHPRVGILSVGEEDSKGTDVVKDARKLLKADSSLNFVGNIESRDLFRGACDVLVCDGFVGNVVLKLIEGLGESILTDVVQNIKAENNPDAEALAIKAVKTTQTKYDFNDYGGAPLLGIEGICMITHGASNARGITNAIRQAKAFSQYQVNDRIKSLLGR